jgi:Ca-activated chloride channel homolog
MRIALTLAVTGLVLVVFACSTPEAADTPDNDVEIARAAQIGDPVRLGIYDVSDLTVPIRSFPGEDINLVPGGGFGFGFGDSGSGPSIRLSNYVAPNLIFNPAGSDIRGLGGETGSLVNLDDVTAGLEDGSAEGYDVLVENDFLDPNRAPLSTFSIDVDTASMSNVRRILRGGDLPPAGAVRIEEMINYFSYDYPEPDGADPFSVTVEVAECPWAPSHRLVHVGLQGRRVKAEGLPARNLVFLLDVSGSMDQPQKLPLVVSAMKLLVNQLGSDDHVGIVVYAGASGVALEPTRGDDRQTILAALDALQAGGSTNGGEGIQAAYDLARRNFEPDSINRVILATDGDFNVGTTDRGDLEKLIESQRDDGIFLTVLGVGTGDIRDSRMEMLADKGNGNYAYLDTPAEARKVLVLEAGATLVTIAKDVKIQVEWNPDRVGSYRLIGYENRVMADRDFNDDTKDAGEIGAGHSVTALYEITGPGERPVEADPLQYQDVPAPGPAANPDALMTLKLRYKMPMGIESSLLTREVLDPGNVAVAATSEDYRFSAAVAAFGLLLRDSKHRGDTGTPLIRDLAHGALGQDPLGHRRAFLDLVRDLEALHVAQAVPDSK